MRYRVMCYRVMFYRVMSATVETIESESEVKVWTKRTLSTLRCAESPLRRQVPYLVSAVQRDHVGPLSDQHGRGDGRVVFQGLERGESGWDWVRLAGPSAPWLSAFSITPTAPHACLVLTYSNLVTVLKYYSTNTFTVQIKSGVSMTDTYRVKISK